MPSLKDLRNRIASTKATQKITKAMQMVAASKLRRAQAAAEAARPYAERMDKVLGNIAASVAGLDSAPRLLRGTGRDNVHLLVVCTAERGLCGPFNSAIVRLARERANRADGRGQGGQDPLRRPQGLRPAEAQFRAADRRTGRAARRARCGFEHAEMIAEKIIALFDKGEFDVCTLFYLALQVGDRADPDRAADHPAGVRGQGGGGARRRASTNTSRTRRTSSPSCCRATSPCRCSARCWRTPRRSTARRCRRWTTPRATPAT